MEDRYARNVPALTEEASDGLRDKRICVIGCGGLGGFVIEMAARIGVGHIVAVDFDRFCQSNLNRQLLSTERNVGELKVDAAKRRAAEVNSSVAVTAIASRFDDEHAQEMLAGCDVAVDALDGLDARLLLQWHCGEMGIPLVHGAIGGWYGQVTTILPGDNSLDLLYARRGAAAQQGNLPFVAAATASVQCAEVIKLLTGRGEVLSKRLMRLDLLSNRCSIIQIQ